MLGGAQRTFVAEEPLGESSSGLALESVRKEEQMVAFEAV